MQPICSSKRIKKTIFPEKEDDTADCAHPHSAGSVRETKVELLLQLRQRSEVVPQLKQLNEQTQVCQLLFGLWKS